MSGWTAADLGRPVTNRQSGKLFFEEAAAPPPGVRGSTNKKTSGSYLTCRKLMAEVGAVYDQSKADGEPDHTDSADQKGKPVAVSAHCSGQGCGHLVRER
jgi:hypothetical protein